MNAPPISEGTFMVEVTRSAIVDPELFDIETGILSDERTALSEDPEFVCANDKPAKAITANTLAENDLIETVHLRTGN
jgi:hypothetical protein